MARRHEQKRVGRRKKITRVKVGGNADQPKSLWDLIVFVLLAPFRMTDVAVEREVAEEFDYSTLEETDERIVPDEQRQELTRDRIRGTLAEEAVDHERKALAEGRSPTARNPGTADEVERLRLEIDRELRQMRDEGWDIRTVDEGEGD